jgi:hypothetical protein
MLWSLGPPIRLIAFSSPAVSMLVWLLILLPVHAAVPVDRPLAVPGAGSMVEIGAGPDGSAGYAYNFNLPASRGRYQPKLRLEYNSKDSLQRGYGVGLESIANVY